MQICSIRGNEWRTSRNSSLFYFVFFHFSRHKTHLPHLSFILLFTPCNIIAWPSYCWPICVYVSVCMSPTAPLCPSSLAWLLSCEERFLLVFGIRGNTSFHEEPSVYGDHSAPPTPHSSPFPYITLSATTSPVFFFLPLAYISCIALAIPSMSLCCAPFTFLCALHIFSAFLALTFCSVICPYSTQAPPTCLKWKAFTHLPRGLLLLRFIEFPWTDPFISVRYCMFVFSRWAVLKVGITQNTLSSVWGCQIL